MLRRHALMKLFFHWQFISGYRLLQQNGVLRLRGGISSDKNESEIHFKIIGQ